MSTVPTSWVIAALVVLSPLVMFLGLVGVIIVAATTETTLAGAQTTGGVNAAAIPAAAVELLPEVQRILAEDCPELPAPWLIAEIEVESNWDPRAYSSSGAAGLTQMLRGSWGEAGGDLGVWADGEEPIWTHPVWDPVTHLEVAVPWMCANLRTITRHVTETAKPITPLQAMAVCHIAGCSRVTGSASGIPEPGEAGCGETCSSQVHSYVYQITELAGRYAAVPIGDPSTGAPAPYTGDATGCVIDDPTSNGCLTGAAAHLYGQVEVSFGSWAWGATCWDEHAWNPTSDHPQGKACDYTVGRLGEFPNPPDTATGWQLANWFVTHAEALQVTYVIYQGTIWQQARAESGWAPYSGGGVYDPSDPTGGHYDHVHVSVRN